MVNAKGKADESLKYVKWLTEKEQGRSFMEMVPILPTNPAALLDPAKVPPQFNTFAGQTTVDKVSTPRAQRVDEALTKGVQALLLREKTVAQVLADAERPRKARSTAVEFRARPAHPRGPSGAARSPATCSCSPALALIGVFTFSPFVQGLALSFQSWDGVGRDTPWVGLANYRRVFGDNIFWASLGNAAIFGLVGFVLGNILSLGMAVAVNSESVAAPPSTGWPTTCRASSRWSSSG